MRAWTIFYYLFLTRLDKVRSEQGSTVYSQSRAFSWSKFVLSDPPTQYVLYVDTILIVEPGRYLRYLLRYKGIKQDGILQPIKILHCIQRIFHSRGR